MATITDGFIVAFIIGGGISLCVSGFSRKGLPLNACKRITGRPAKLIGIVSLLLSLIAAAAWIVLKGAAI
jgi:hypothetical protein